MKLAFALTSLIASTSALDRKLYGVDYDIRASEWGGCKQEWELRADFNAMKSIARNVRVYGTQEPCIDRVLKVAAETNVHLFLGLWGNIYADQDNFDKEFATFKKLVYEGKIRNDNIVGMHVSSEAMFRYYIQDKHDWSDLEGTFKLTSYVDTVRKFVRERGLNFPVTIADVMDSYKYTHQLYPAVDVVAANQFSQWENIWAKDGVNTMFERLKNIQISSRAAGKQILIAETGWSANGSFPSIKEATPEASGLYLREFLLFAEQQNLNFYYFTSFNLKWGDDSAFGLIEKNFGLFDQNRNLLPHVSSVVVGKIHKAVRLWHQGKVIKCDGANTDTIGRVYLEEPTTGLTDSIEREIWFYDEDHKTFRSKSTNQCLDTYIDDNGVSQLHVYWCDVTNANQHWDFHADGTYEVVSSPELYIDATTTIAPTQPPPRVESHPAPQFLAECGDCRNCQFFTPYYSLCYANWQPSDCSQMPKTTHRWCGALPEYVPTIPPTLPPTAAPTKHGEYLGPKATEVRVQVGALISLSEKAPGKCIRANGNALEVIPCNFEEATKFSIRPFESEEVTIRIVGTEWKITEYYGQVQSTTDPIANAHRDTQIWFYDPLAKTIRNKANSQGCLQLVEDKINGAVESRLCDSENFYQTWSYNDLTGQIYFMEKMGLCLATYGPNQPLHVEFCDINVRNQKWQFELVQGAYEEGYDQGQDYPSKRPVPPPCQYVTPPPFTKKPVPPPCEYVTPPPCTTSRPVPPPCHYETTLPPTEPPTEAPTTTIAATTTPAPTEAPTTTPAPTDAPTTLETATLAPPTEEPSTAAPVPPPCHTTTETPTTPHTRRPLPSPCDINEKSTTVAPTTDVPVPTQETQVTDAPTSTSEVPVTVPLTDAPTTTVEPTTTVAPATSEPTIAPATTETAPIDTPTKAAHTRRPLPPPCSKDEMATTTPAPTPCHTNAPRSGETTVTKNKHVVISHNKPKTPCPQTTTSVPATEAPATQIPETDAPETTASTLDLSTCSKYKVTVGDSSWAILNKTCAGYSGSCKKDSLPTIINDKGKRCSSLLTVGEEVNVCCPVTTTAAPIPEPPTVVPSTSQATDAPTTEAPTTAAPATEAPTTVAPVTDAPTTPPLATDAPTTAAPATEAPTTEAPATPIVTEAQVTEAPAPSVAPTVAPTTTAAPATTAAPTPVVVPTEPVAYINYFIEQHACVGFGASWCQACEWTKETIADIGGSLTFLELDTKAGAGPTGDAISTALTKLTGSTSYPSIWIGGKYIGSSDKIADLDDQGKLKALLQAAGCA